MGRTYMLSNLREILLSPFSLPMMLPVRFGKQAESILDGNGLRIFAQHDKLCL